MPFYTVVFSAEACKAALASAVSVIWNSHISCYICPCQHLRCLQHSEHIGSVFACEVQQQHCIAVDRRVHSMISKKAVTLLHVLTRQLNTCCSAIMNCIFDCAVVACDAVFEAERRTSKAESGPKALVHQAALETHSDPDYLHTLAVTAAVIAPSYRMCCTFVQP